MSKWRLYGVLVYDGGRLYGAGRANGAVCHTVYGDLASGGYLLNGGRG